MQWKGCLYYLLLFSWFSIKNLFITFELSVFQFSSYVRDYKNIKLPRSRENILDYISAAHSGGN